MNENPNRRPPEPILLAAVEAVIFAAGEPVLLREIATAFGGMDERELEQATTALIEDYERRRGGLVVERVAGGLRLATRPEVGEWVRQFFRQRNRTRLSPAALETLAIVAYRQPVTAPEIQGIRGVDPTAALKSLVEKKMVRILGRKRVVGSPLLYGTSKQFLVHFGLNSLEDLPPLDDLGEFLGLVESGEIAMPQAATLLAESGDVVGAQEEEAPPVVDRSEEE